MFKFFKKAPNFWYQKDILRRIISYFLLPFSFVYLMLIIIRRLCYFLGFTKTTYFYVPIIVIGNIIVGGSGKTPLVIWLAQFLRQQGYRVGIVSRGYEGRIGSAAIVVSTNSDVRIVGDEALLIAQQTKCPMVVAHNRVGAVRKLLQCYPCDVILSDDGLQHYALGRTIEIAVVDSKRGFGNGFCFPAGPLREPIFRLKTVDFVVKNNCAVAESSQAVAESSQYVMQFVPEKIYYLHNHNITKELHDLRGMSVHAFAGIGNPANFFKLLRTYGIIVHEHIFPDHYSYIADDLNLSKNAMIIMTTKDAVKCERFTVENCWVLPIKVEMNKKFEQDFMSLLNTVSNNCSGK